MDDYLFFLLQSGGSDSPGRRGMTKGYVAPRQAWRRFARPEFGRDRGQRLPAAPPRRALNPPRRRPRRRPGLKAAGGRAKRPPTAGLPRRERRRARVLGVSRRHRRAGLFIHHAGVLDAGRVLRPPAAARSDRRRVLHTLMAFLLADTLEVHTIALDVGHPTVMLPVVARCERLPDVGSFPIAIRAATHSSALGSVLAHHQAKGKTTTHKPNEKGNYTQDE